MGYLSRVRVALRRYTPWLGATLLLILLVGLIWLVVTGLLVRSTVKDLRRDLDSLRHAVATGDLDRARSLAVSLEKEASRAHGLTSGPAWWVASGLPGLGEPLYTVRVVAAQADVLAAEVLPGLLQTADTLESGTLWHGKQIDLDELRSLEPALATASRDAHSAADAIARTSGSTWLHSVDSPRTSLLQNLDELSGQLDRAARAVTAAVPMLGADGTRRYFIAFMNEAESRGLGGLPGGFGVLTIDHGAIDFEQFGSDTELLGYTSTTALPADFTARYGPQRPASDYRNSDISANMPYAAQIWAGMWQAKTGEHVDGALAVDPTALSYLLKAIGPATMPDGRTVGADNVVDLLQKDQYSLYDDDNVRNRFANAIALAVSQRITSRGGSPRDAVTAVARAATERRLMMWSAHPDEQAVLEQAGWAGTLDSQGRPFAGFTVNNMAGSKLDYYLDRTTTYTRTSCTGPATATLTLTNGAPPHGLPYYVRIRADDPSYPVQPGDNLVAVTYYATPGARIESLVLDGKSLPVVTGTENGLVVVSATVELPVGRARTVTVTLAEPATHGPVQVLDTPLVRAQTVKVSEPAC